GLDVTTTAVSFQKNVAYATVSIHPKGDPSIQSMVMKYTLEDRDGKWVVVNVADSQGHGMTGHRSANTDQALPPGHPPVNGEMPGAASARGGTGPKQCRRLPFYVEAPQELPPLRDLRAPDCALSSSMKNWR